MLPLTRNNQFTDSCHIWCLRIVFLQSRKSLTPGIDDRLRSRARDQRSMQAPWWAPTRGRGGQGLAFPSSFVTVFGRPHWGVVTTGGWERGAVGARSIAETRTIVSSKPTANTSSPWHGLVRSLLTSFVHSKCSQHYSYSSQRFTTITNGYGLHGLLKGTRTF